MTTKIHRKPLTKSKPRTRVLALGTGSASGAHVVKAWAIVNDDTGRLMLIDVSIGGMMPARMDAAAIYMTKAAAEHNRADNERLVRVAITEI